jgi:hypothetical protein
MTSDAASLHLPDAFDNDADITFSIISATNSAFNAVLQLRAAVLRGSSGVPQTDPEDEYSEHYCAFSGGCLVAALRVTRASQGPLDCEEHYPQALLEQFRPQLCTASRFVAVRSLPVEWRIPHKLIRYGWVDQLKRGTRLDIINIHRRALSYYGGLDYELLKDSFFTHPRWGTPSLVMVFPATASRATPLHDLFAGIPKPLELAELERVVELDCWQDYHTANLDPLLGRECG